MSIQASVFENGEWVTRAVTAEQLMKSNGRTHRTGFGRQAPSEPPTCALLTRTIADSPLVRWVFPVRLRSAQFNDVAFIGDNFVQIYELDELDRQPELRDVKKKRGFSSRIRNVVVMGAENRHPEDETTGHNFGIKTEDDVDTNMTEDNNFNSLPPQLLVLMLENGQILFLYMENTNGEWIFQSCYHQMPGHPSLFYPGYHFAVDPQSRYLCLAYPEQMFFICELETMEELRRQHALGKSLKPIKTIRGRDAIHGRAVHGCIGNINFLHPSVDAESHVILLIILVREKATKITYFEWEHGHEDVTEVLRADRSGHKLHDDFRLPLMVIPLTVRSAFIIVTEGALATISGLLEGSLMYDTFGLVSQNATEYHHGKSHPLCVAWTRPVRETQFHETQDVIYLVREDGIINFLEVGVESGIETSLEMGEVQCNFDTAFACMYNRFGDVLLAGGNSGPGAIWRINPKAKLELIRKVSNWSPMHDITVMSQQRGSQLDRHQRPGTLTSSSLAERSRESSMQVDRVFACTGKGKFGAITEFRHGLQARIGLDIEYHTIVRQCWVTSSAHIMADIMAGDFIILLLALPDGSAILGIPEYGDAEGFELTNTDVPWDLAASTLAFMETETTSIQVTTSSIVVVTSHSQHRISAQELFEDSGASVAHASILGDHVLLAARYGSSQKLAILQCDGAKTTVIQCHDINDEITCLSLAESDSGLIALAGTWHGRSVQLTVYPAEGKALSNPAKIMLPLQALSSDVTPGTEQSLCPSPIEPLTSIVPLSREINSLYLAAGTRSGEVLTIGVRLGNHSVTVEKFGVTPAKVTTLSTPDEPLSVVVTNNEEPIVLTKFSCNNSDARFEQKSRVWITEAEEANFPSKSINAVVRMPPQSSNERELMHLIMISGAQIMYNELRMQPQPVMRQFLTNGEPEKVLYRADCHALVAAVLRDGHSALCLFDPETGIEISQPHTLVRTGPDGKKQQQPADKIDGLSSATDYKGPAVTITSLGTWNMRQGNYIWPYLLVGCRTEPREPGRNHKGSLLVVRVDAESPASSDRPRKVPIMRQIARKFDAPVHSITSNDHGVFVCSGNIVQYLQVDPATKQLEPRKSFELPSLAMAMQIKSEKLHVITKRHSLVILDYTSDSLGSEHMVLLHSDEMTRSSKDIVQVGSFLQHERRESVAMLSDEACGIHGLWSTSQDDSGLHVVFQAEMRASIIRFARANIRPPWTSHNRQIKYGCLQSGRDDSDIIGISMDGALHHFTLLNEHAWRLLRFIQNLAMASPALGSCHRLPNSSGIHGPEPQPLPKRMLHVEGDILQQCLEQRAVQMLVSEHQHARRLQQLLREVIDSEKQSGQDAGLADEAVNFDLVYEILEYYMSPLF